MEVLTPKLSVKNLSKSFDGRQILHNLSFDLMEGEFLSILGPSGCGKTTLLRILIGLENADSGEIRKGDQEISQLPSSRRGMGIVFQNYALFPNMTRSCRIWTPSLCPSNTAKTHSRASRALHWSPRPTKTWTEA